MTQFPITAQEAYRAMTEITDGQDRHVTIDASEWLGDDQDAQLAEQARDDAAAEEVYQALVLAPYQELADHALAAIVIAWETDVADLQGKLHEVRAEVQRRIEDAGGRQLAVEGFKVELVNDSPTYDYDRLIALREALEPDDWAKVHKDAYEKLTKVPAKFDGTQLRKVERDFGSHVREIIEAARIPGRSHVVVERR